MTTIYIVRKHRVSFNAFYGGATLKAFEIFSTHATRKEAHEVAKAKNKRSNDYEYMVGKVSLKGEQA